MKGFQDSISLATLGLLSITLIASIATAAHVLSRRRSRTDYVLGGAAVAATAALVWSSYHTLASLSAFDWIDLCRPAGTNICVANGRPLQEIEFGTWFSLQTTFLIYIVAIALTALSGVRLFRRMFKPE